MQISHQFQGRGKARCLLRPPFGFPHCVSDYRGLTGFLGSLKIHVCLCEVRRLMNAIQNTQFEDGKPLDCLVLNTEDLATKPEWNS